jgi:ABC-2 type transport system ATP-binding protein
MLTAQDLIKAYAGVRVVHGVSLELRPGRVIGLVGANGAGKTTTIKMLAGLLDPTSGSARLDGRPTREPKARQSLGYLPEESPLYDDETPASYLRFFASLYGLPAREARTRATDLLARLSLRPEDAKKPIGTLSKGMRRKVAIARTVLHDPSVLVLDEPTSGLDPFTARELDRFIRELRDQGKAILLSAHNLQQIEDLADEIIIMHQGRVVAQGSLAQLRGQWGVQRYTVRATHPFPQSAPEGQHHEAHLTSLEEVEAAIEGVKKQGGTILEVVAVPPRLEEILERVAGA